MKIEALKQRLDRNRPMTSVTVRIPVDVVEDLKRLGLMLKITEAVANTWSSVRVLVDITKAIALP